MKLIILGCGSSMGSPWITNNWGSCIKKNKYNFRTRCSVFIKKGNLSILIDTSPDIRQQILNNNIKDIDYVLYTHEHADQTSGIFELRPFSWKYKKKIDIFADKKTLLSLNKKYDYCFYGNHGYKPIVKGHVIKRKFKLSKKKDKIIFNTFNVEHGKVSSLAYLFEKTAYISDCNRIQNKDLNKLKNLNFLIIDCLKIKNSPSHFNLNEVLTISYFLKPKKTILTNLHIDLDYNFLKKKLPSNIIPAYDGMQLNI